MAKQLGINLPGSQGAKARLNIYTGLLAFAVMLLITAVVIVGNAAVIVSPAEGGAFPGALTSGFEIQDADRITLPNAQD